MNDKEVERQKKRVKKYLLKWREILGLNGHRITYHWDRSYDGQERTVAMCNASWQYLNHSITFYLPAVMEMLEEDQLEETVVHEMVHILLHPISGDFEDKTPEQVQQTEFTTSTVARAIMWAEESGRKTK